MVPFDFVVQLGPHVGVEPRDDAAVGGLLGVGHRDAPQRKPRQDLDCKRLGDEFTVHDG